MGDPISFTLLLAGTKAEWDAYHPGSDGDERRQRKPMPGGNLSALRLADMIGLDTILSVCEVRGCLRHRGSGPDD